MDTRRPLVRVVVMGRYMLIRNNGGDESLVAETQVPLEADLHDALTKHPELLPSEDMDLGRTVVVGREVECVAGFADLILLDERGQICVVEVKKQGNADVRRVVAQLLDYASALWGQTLPEFEQDVFLPYARALNGDAPTSLRAFLADQFAQPVAGTTSDDERQPSVDEIETALRDNLRSGRFVLVVAAPDIPEPVHRVLEYVNAQGLRVYGLELSYFEEKATECFVPRLAVQPPPTNQIAMTSARPHWDQPTILQRLRDKSDEATKVAEAIFKWVDSQGLQRWYGRGRIDGACWFGKDDDRGRLRLLSIWTTGEAGEFQIQFADLASGKHPAFEPVERRRELQRRLSELPGISIADDKIDKWAYFSLLALADPDVRTRFLGVMDWAIEQARSNEPPGSGVVVGAMPVREVTSM